MRVTLIDGQGNFGSMDPDPPASMRYTEARLAKVAMTLLEDLDKDTVDFTPNYDGSREEPQVLPARFPNLLVNGAGGIAVGMATNIPPHNLGEVIAACKAYMDDPGDHHRRADRDRPRPRFPDRAADPRPGRRAQRLSYRPRLDHHARPPRDRGRPRRPPLDRADLHPLPGRQERPGREDRRGRQGQADRGRLRHSRRIEPRGRPGRHRPEARRHPRRRPQPALAAHPGPVELPGQHARDPRRPARDAEPARHHRGLRPLPRGGDHPARQVRARQGPRPRPHLARPGHRGHQSRRGGADHPRLRLAGRGARRPDRPRMADRRDRALHRAGRGGRDRGRGRHLSPVRRPGPRHPRASPPPPDRARPRRDCRRAARAGHLDRRAARDPRRPGQALRGDARGVRRDRRGLTPRRASPRSRPPGTGSRTRI